MIAKLSNCTGVTTVEKKSHHQTHGIIAMGTHNTRRYGCGICVGKKIVTHAHTHHTHTHRSMWVLKPMIITRPNYQDYLCQREMAGRVL